MQCSVGVLVRTVETWKYGEKVRAVLDRLTEMSHDVAVLGLFFPCFVFVVLWVEEPSESHLFAKDSTLVFL